VRQTQSRRAARTAEDPVRARAFLLRASLIESLREAEQIGVTAATKPPPPARCGNPLEFQVANRRR